MVTVRPERKKHYSVIHEINVLAFGGEEEARLIRNIRKSSNFIRNYPLWL